MSDPPSDTYKPVRREDVEWVDLDGEAVLHDREAEIMHRLNPAATAVWEACDGSKSVAAIVGVLKRAHPGAGDVLARDVRELIQTLRRLDLLAESPPQA